MKKKKQALVWVLSVLFSITACATPSDNSVSSSHCSSSELGLDFSSSSSSSSSSETSSEEIPDPVQRYVEGIRDAGFDQGFAVIGNDRASDGTKPKMYVKTGDGDIIWRVAQWNSKYDFTDNVVYKTSASTLLHDESKSLRVNRILHTATLAIDTTKEYETMATSRINWAHLLLSQGLEPFEEYRLSDFQSLDVALDFSVTKAVKGAIEIRDEDGAFPAPNSLPAQFLQYIYVVNKNPQSPGYNNFMWFGVGYMDTRMAVKPVGYLQDFAGGKAGNFIYGMSSIDTLGEEPFEIGKLYHVCVDVLPHIEIALKTAQEHGFMLHTTLQDCTLTGMNIGWELPGAWDVSATISNLSIKGIFKEEV